MGLYDKYIVPRLVNYGCGTKPILKQREKIVPRASGVVLEIGIGTGHNLPYYDGSKVERVIGLDPSAESWQLAAERARGLPFPVDFIGLPGEQIPLDDNSVDTVLVTYALCTIPDPVTALEGMARVLRPGGELLFCEHGQAPDQNVRLWQERINPWWRPLMGGCNLQRHIPEILAAGGFAIDKLEEMYLPNTPKIAGYQYWGVAKAIAAAEVAMA